MSIIIVIIILHIGQGVLPDWFGTFEIKSKLILQMVDESLHHCTY